MNSVTVLLPDGTTETIRIARKRNMRRAILHAEPDGSFWISMPFVSAEQVQAIVAESLPWIAEQKKKLEKPAPEVQCISYLGDRYEVEYEENENVSVTLATDTKQMIVRGPSRTTAKDFFEFWWSEAALDIFQAHVDRWYEKLKDQGIPRPRISVRKMRTRWGSCTPSKGTIRLNTLLLRYAPDLIDYIVLHEMGHLLHPNHQAGFQKFLYKYMPDWNTRREKLRELPEHTY